MNEHCIKNLKNRFEESPSPLPERKNPHMPWELEPDTEIPIIPEDPDGSAGSTPFFESATCPFNVLLSVITLLLLSF